MQSGVWSVAAEDQPDEATALGRALSLWFEEVEAQLASEPTAAWAREATPVYGQPVERLPLVDARSVAAAVYMGRRRTAATDAFLNGNCEQVVDFERLRDIARADQPAWTTAWRGDAGESASLVVYAPGGITVTWRLPPAVHAAAAEPGAAVVLTTALDTRAAPLRDACVAHGLSGLQTRVALGAIRLGGIRAAADELGISYQTAREALAGAMKRVGARRLPELVTRLTTLAFGVFPGRPASGDVLMDVWGLTERQTAVAGLVADGASREKVARLMDLSLPVVKKELDAVYALMQVGSAAALARTLVEARAHSWLTDATAGGVGYVEDQSEPLRFVLRPDGGQIAYSDYGPASGRPVLILHSSMTTRIVSRKLLRALHRSGFRPIAIDRPGFGLSDPLDDPAAVADPFGAATADVARVLAHLRIRRIDIISRGAAQFLVALASALPHAIGRVVLVNPGPPYRESGRGLGPLGVMKDTFVRNPALTRTFAGLVAGRLTYRRLERMMHQWTRGSPPDETAVRDPELVADFFRSVRMFATGRYEGFVREQAAISRGGPPEPFLGARGWSVLLGSSDVLYDPQVVLAYWTERLPRAHFRVVRNGGRFLAMTHADLVIEALAPD